LIFYEVAPRSFFIEFAIIKYTNGSILIDFTPVNQTKRYIEAPIPATAPEQVRESALIFKDIFNVNGTQRAFYVNGTIAILNANGGFIRYERAPEWKFGDCRPEIYTDGRKMLNCSLINGTLIVFFPPQTIRNTAYENATAPFKDEITIVDFSFIRYFINGTRIRYTPDGEI